MALTSNPLKAALKQGRPQFGLWQTLASSIAAEICAGSGFDWLLFDGEHAPNDIPSLLAQLQTVEAYPVHAVARVPFGEAYLIKQYLDLGFLSLLVPLVETEEQARALVRAVRYPPAGMRGLGPGRASRWGRKTDYIHRADDEICLLVQAETKRALENLDAIARVDGVDCVFIGPSDLSASLGHRGDPAHADVQAAIADAIRHIRAAGKAAGILVADNVLAKKYLELGCTFVGVGSDSGVLAKSTSELAARFKGQ